MKMFESTATPRFILGEDLDRKEWLVHLRAPRFACRVRQIDEDLPVFSKAENEEPDTYIFDMGEEALTDFVWIDAKPNDQTTLHRLLSDAADFVEAITAADMEDDE